MKVILTKGSSLGRVGDQVTVKPGFARNYLIPGQYAVRATKQSIEAFEAKRAEFEKKELEALEAAKVRADHIAASQLTISMQAGEGGKLFGAVGPRDIVDAASQAGFHLAKREVIMPEGPIRLLGEFEVITQLHSEVKATLKVEIVPNS